ncbi:MAG TPA: hypothetical protein VK598_03515 [Nitrospiraceae bacterium]|nr:hypothetical protein [Nitrospiraceae bacterium]
MSTSLRNVCVLMVLLVLPGCGVVHSYVHNEDKLEKPFSMLMTQSDVEATLGEPGKVVRDSGQILVLEYRLYPRYHWMKELVACPFTAWLGGCFFYPAIGVGDPNYPKPFYVLLYNDRLCVWGTLEAVRASTGCHTPSGVPSDVRRTAESKLPAL